jgi:hypothetical protein
MALALLVCGKKIQSRIHGFVHWKTIPPHRANAPPLLLSFTPRSKDRN